MGGIALEGDRVYLDTNVVIYIVEGYQEHAVSLVSLLTAADEGKLTLMTSDLTLAESLAKPLADGRQDLVEVYERFLSADHHREMIPVSRSILREAAELRGTLGLKLPDAIHVASAVFAKCDVFLTNDAGMRVPPPLRAVRPGALVG